MTAAPKSAELLPCPFCGANEPSVWLYQQKRFANNKLWAAHCKICNIERTASTKAEAIAAWNTRAAAQTPPSAGVEDGYARAIEDAAKVADDQRDFATANLRVGHRPAHYAGVREGAKSIAAAIRLLQKERGR